MKERRHVIWGMIFVVLFPIIANAGRYYDARTARWMTPDPRARDYPQWSPYNYAVDNPVIFLDPNGKEVRVYTERLSIAVYSRSSVGFIKQIPLQFQPHALLFGGMVWEGYGPRHSFVQITTDSENKMIELGGPLPGHGEGNPLTNDAAGATERPGQLEHSVDSPEGGVESDYSFEKKILEIHNAMSEFIRTNRLPLYEATGTNSNSYVEFLIQAAGGKVILPSNATGHSSTQTYWEIYQTLKKRREEDAKVGSGE